MSLYPYVGLRPYQRDEADIFFGREEHTDELLNKLAQQHFLAVLGVSGCGKSSLVKAGLIPSLEAGFLNEAGTHWRIAEMRPGDYPFANLATALVNALDSNYHTDLIQDDILKRGSFSLHELLAINPLKNQAKLLIICDQFEEIFRYHQKTDNSEAAAFIALLLVSAKPYILPTGKLFNDIYVVITMRSDFLGDCALFTDLAEAINEGLYLTPRLNREQLRLAIEEPALSFCGEVKPELVTRLLTDAGNNQDQLPLLQHILMRLWNLAADKNPVVLTLSDYEKLGGVNLALSNHADEIYNALTNEQQRIAEILFRNLTEYDSGKRDTRRPIQIIEIIKLTDSSLNEVVAVIDAYRQTGCCFLMPPINVILTEFKMIDISHESLIRQWKRLKIWTEDEAQSAKKYKRLVENALRYNNKEVDLLSSTELDIMQKWRKQFKPTKIWADRYGGNFTLAERFLNASESARRNKTIFYSLLALTFVVAVTYAVSTEKSKEQLIEKGQLLEAKNIELSQANKELEKSKEELSQVNKKLENINIGQEKQYIKTTEQYKTTISFLRENVSEKEIIFLYNKLNDPFVWREQGDRLVEKNKKEEAKNYYNKAINGYKQIITDNPEHQFAFYYLATVYYRLQYFNDAITYFNKQIDINPDGTNSGFSWYYLGQIYQQRKIYVEAVKAYQKAIKMNPNIFVTIEAKKRLKQIEILTHK
jgi:tetratricopeptide (TPR) repeat protein